MDIATKNLDPYTIEARITLDAQELNEYVRRTTEALTGHVAVEGFRKGKAPAHLAKEKLDPKIVRAEALELAIGESFTQASAKESWDIAKTAELKVERNDETGLAFVVNVHVWPVVTLTSLDSVKVPRKDIDASEKEVEDALDTVRNMRATFLDKTGPAAEGDRVEVDFDATMDGKPVEGGSSRNHPMVIGGRSFMPGFEEQMIGLAAGQEHRFTLTAPADYHEAKLAGREVSFTVTVRRVQAVLKPAADDAFAKSLGTFTDVGQLRASLREGILKEKAAREQMRLRLAILDAIIASSTVPAPVTMTNDELDEMIHRFSHDLGGRGIELGMYLAKLGKTQEQLRDDWRTEAERQVRIMLVLRAVAKEQGIGVPPEDLEAAVNETVAELIKEGGAAQAQVDPERIREALAQRMLRDRTLEFIERHCAA